MNRPENAMKMAIAFILALGLIGYVMLGFVGVLFTAAFIGGLVLWLLTTYRQPIEPWPIMFPYLVTVLAFFVHVYEEFAFHVESDLSRLAGTEVTQAQFLTIAAFAGPIAWIAGAAGMVKRWRFGFFLASTFLFGMMFAEFSHFLNPFLEDGTFHYTAGMYTCFLPIAAAWYTFVCIRREIGRARDPQAIGREGLRDA